MLSKLLGMFSSDMAIDLGTANTLIGDISANTSNLISAAIDAQDFPYEFPGADAEPGHRELRWNTTCTAVPTQARQASHRFPSTFGMSTV